MGLDALEIILEVEDRFAISIGDTEASEAYTVGQLYHIVLKKMDPSSYSEQQAWDVLCNIISKQLAIRKERILPESRFVEDLGIE